MRAITAPFAVQGVDAGAADLDEVATDRVEAGEVELALGVEAAGDTGALGRQQPVRADDVPCVGLPHEQVVAVGVEGVGVETRLGSVEPGAHLSGEHLVAQALRGTHLLLVTGERDEVAGLGLLGRNGNGRRGGEGRGQRGGDGERRCGHGGLLCRTEGRTAGAAARLLVSSVAGWIRHDRPAESGCEDAECRAMRGAARRLRRAAAPGRCGSAVPQAWLRLSAAPVARGIGSASVVRDRGSGAVARVVPLRTRGAGSRRSGAGIRPPRQGSSAAVILSDAARAARAGSCP